MRCAAGSWRCRRRRPDDRSHHSHAAERLDERGALPAEIEATVLGGESFPVKHGRTGYRRNFAFGGTWRGKVYATKQIEAYAVWEDKRWLVITVLVKYF